MVRPYTYVGLTFDVEKRVVQHNAGQGRATAPYRPFKLFLVEEFRTREAARKREKFLKSGVGREWLKDLRTAQ